MSDPKALNVEGEMKTQDVHHRLEVSHISWFHVKAILVAGVGFFTDAYDLCIISIIKPILGILYYPQFNGKLPQAADLWLTGVALAGTLLGQVFFGILGDKLGRKTVYLFTLLLMITATIGQALSAQPLHGVLYLDYVWRIIVGLGCVPAVLTIYLRNKLPETPRFTADVIKDTAKAEQDMDYVTQNVGRDWKQEAVATPMKQQDRITWRKLHHYLTYPDILHNRNIWVLIGTCTTWFLLDIAFYSQILFLPNVLTAINYNPSIKLPNAAWYKANPEQYPDSMFVGRPANVTITIYLGNTPKCVGACAVAVFEKSYKTAAGNAIVAMMGTVPGYWFTIGLVDFMGRVTIQTMGFALMTILLIILASAYNHIVHVSKWLFIVLYALTFFFANFGPNTTTFITPVELFNTKFRSTLHGFSAASGKAGAIVGAFAIGKLFLDTKISLQTTLAILAATNFVGLICTMFIPETKHLPLDVASSQTQSMFAKLLAKRGIRQVDPESVALVADAHGGTNGDVGDGAKPYSEPAAGEPAAAHDSNGLGSV
ncbi:hypothetical protein WJX72_000158 [[Myrmecia] bisecta]|uniref:Major facilitator superfamily (MFS) profile domain-containing protein n=1 Tax=[Myrmecia] bisecta TaxID=41462 RepID=A0AAW1P7D8_9CHLO